MSAIAYTVCATFPDEATASEYIVWLQDGHIDAVIAHGAHSGMIVRIEDPPSPIRVDTRYTFTTREVFERYVEHFAPALRAEGVRRFGSRPGVGFQRVVGVVL